MEMVTPGGVTRGYCEIGRKYRAIPPTSVMISDSTVAKIGRSMKKREIIAHLKPDRGDKETRRRKPFISLALGLLISLSPCLLVSLSPCRLAWRPRHLRRRRKCAASAASRGEFPCGRESAATIQPAPDRPSSAPQPREGRPIATPQSGLDGIAPCSPHLTPKHISNLYRTE